MTTFFYVNDINHLNLEGDLAIDTEAMGLNTHRDRLCMVQLSNGDGNAHLISFDGSDYTAPNLKKILLNKDVKKIMHFARFDLAIIKYYLDVDLENIYCTKIASKIARTYTDSHGLKELCRELLSVNLSKQQQSSDWGNVNITNEQKEYAASDVLYLHQIRDKLNLMLKRENRYNLVCDCFNFLQTRVRLDLGGWTTDIFEH